MNRRLIGKLTDLRHKVCYHMLAEDVHFSHHSIPPCTVPAPNVQAMLVADPFQATELPETVEEVLQRGTATCAEFNPWGTLLAGMTGRPRPSYAHTPASPLHITYKPVQSAGKPYRPAITVHRPHRRSNQLVAAFWQLMMLAFRPQLEETQGR